jgi:hypothetical protein
MPFKNVETGQKYHAAYGKKNRDRITARRHGLSLEEYQDLLIRQHGVCAVCFKAETTVHGVSKRIQPLSIDHNHLTGKVEGLLCSKCNTAKGLLDDSCERAQALINYLERSK